jgi:ribulose-bisphosphate carboxylase large chain
LAAPLTLGYPVHVDLLRILAVEQLIKCTYIATQPDRDPEVLAENIAREQSLELTRALIPEPIADRLLGRILSVTKLDARHWQLEIGYPTELASGQVGQLLHLIYGNISFYPGIRLVDLAVPDGVLNSFPGPMAGIPGIRAWTGVEDRALLMTVLKPRGSDPADLACLAQRFALSGGDLIKDDQNLVESELDAFSNRVTLCAQAVERAADQSGRKCLYLPHVAGSGTHLHRQLDHVARLGLGGVVMCPWVVGLETAATAAREHGLMWLAHPAVAGVFTEGVNRGIATPVLLGTMVRIAGADISIFPGSGGRITSHHGDDEAATCAALTGELGNLRPSLPCTGGGKTLEQAPETARLRGPDCAVLVGGDLIGRGEALETAVRETVARLSSAGRAVSPG